MTQTEQIALRYLNEHRQEFLEIYTRDIKPMDEKSVIFTAGMSGAGKTEFAIYLKEQNPNLLHIDTDEIRKFFTPVGYDGQNAELFQKASSRGFTKLFDYALKQNFSMILDTNLASFSQARENIERLLKRGYNIQIVYIYNTPEECFKYAIEREVVTHRKVPKDVFVRSNENSYRTVKEIKKHFKEKITVNFIDRRTNMYHLDIDEIFLKEKLGENFED